MSRQTVSAFYDKLLNDPVLKERLKTVLLDLRGDGMDQVAEAVVRLGGETGFAMDVDEVKAVMNDASRHAAGALSDGELDAVAGGIAASLQLPSAGKYASSPRLGAIEAIGIAVVLPKAL